MIVNNSPKSENRIKDSLLKLENATFLEEPSTDQDLNNNSTTKQKSTAFKKYVSIQQTLSQQTSNASNNIMMNNSAINQVVHPKIQLQQQTQYQAMYTSTTTNMNPSKMTKSDYTSLENTRRAHRIYSLHNTPYFQQKMLKKRQKLQSSPENNIRIIDRKYNSPTTINRSIDKSYISERNSLMESINQIEKNIGSGAALSTIVNEQTQQQQFQGQHMFINVLESSFQSRPNDKAECNNSSLESTKYQIGALNSHNHSIFTQDMNETTNHSISIQQTPSNQLNSLFMPGRMKKYPKDLKIKGVWVNNPSYLKKEASQMNELKSILMQTKLAECQSILQSTKNVDTRNKSNQRNASPYASRGSSSKIQQLIFLPSQLLQNAQQLNESQDHLSQHKKSVNEGILLKKIQMPNQNIYKNNFQDQTSPRQTNQLRLLLPQLSQSTNQMKSTQRYKEPKDSFDSQKQPQPISTYQNSRSTYRNSMKSQKSRERGSRSINNPESNSTSITLKQRFNYDYANSINLSMNNKSQLPGSAHHQTYLKKLSLVDQPNFNQNSVVSRESTKNNVAELNQSHYLWSAQNPGNRGVSFRRSIIELTDFKVL
ncbi:UNKNOWN [Stylonychia lemnae]|uniref:Uncharacterized protein n=1 Tax=Stylonychia lemnae TaxID=5949 RepID=A0A078AXE2_STYLE|nr:UNKNOWN [Stylonychia lemnae]|eukprot:CDW85892.1 UNKNOWN [Stylonychia lemnae]